MLNTLLEEKGNMLGLTNNSKFIKIKREEPSDNLQ